MGRLGKRFRTILDSRFMLLFLAFMALDWMAPAQAIVFDTMAAFRSYPEPTGDGMYAPTAIMLQNNRATFYLWRSSCPGADDGVNYIKPAGSTGCWMRATNNYLTVSAPLLRLADNISLDTGWFYNRFTTSSDITWSSVGGKPSFATVATSGSYSDLFNRPTLFSGAYADLTGKPSLFSGAYGDLTGKPTLFSGSYLDLTSKPALFSGSYTDLTNKPTIPTNTNQLTNGAGFLTAIPAQTWTSITGKPSFATVATSGSYADLMNKPTIASDYSNTVNVAGSAGQAVFYLTSDRTASGTALYTTVTSVLPIVNDVTKNYTYGWTLSGDKKTLTVTTQSSAGVFIQLLNLTLLGAPTPVPAGTPIFVTVKGQ